MSLKKRVICGVGFLGLSVNAHAALFYQVNQDAAGLGDAQSGKAAMADDASAEFNNPAGLVQIKDQQLVMGANAVIPDYEYRGSSSYIAATPAIDENGTVNDANFYYVPYLHYAAPISDKWAFGFGTSTPFKMKSDWGSDSVVSSIADETEFTATDISTDLAYKPAKFLSFGAGYDVVRIAASDYNYVTPSNSSSGRYKTDSDSYSWSHAWHAGAMLFINPNNRVGIAYHSPINFTSQGSASAVSSDGTTLTRSDNYKIDGTLPATSTISVFHGVNDKWSLQASVGFEQWDQFSEVTFYNVPTDSGVIAEENVDYHLQNTWRTAVGAHYILNPMIMLRTGLAYETSPVTDESVYIQAPSDEIYTLSAGIHVNRSKEWAFDFGWSHLFYTDQSVNTDASTAQNDTILDGTVESSSDIVGASFTWNMP